MAHDGNNFQWKINVPIRGFAVFVVCPFMVTSFLQDGVPSGRLPFRPAFLPAFRWGGVLTLF